MPLLYKVWIIVLANKVLTNDQKQTYTASAEKQQNESIFLKLLWRWKYHIWVTSRQNDPWDNFNAPANNAQKWRQLVDIVGYLFTFSLF